MKPAIATVRRVAVTAGVVLLLGLTVTAIVGRQQSDPRDQAAPGDDSEPDRHQQSPSPEDGLDAQDRPCYFLLQPLPANPHRDDDVVTEAETCHYSDGPTLLPPAGDEEPRIADFPNLRPQPSPERP